MSSSEDRLRRRLKRAGANGADNEVTEDIINLALDELRKRERSRTRALGARIKSLKEEIERLRAQRDQNTLHVSSASHENPTGGNRIDRLAGIRDEIVRALAALVQEAEKTKSSTDGKSLSATVLGLQRAIRNLVLILCVGMGIVVPGMVLLLVLAGMRLQIP